MLKYKIDGKLMEGTPVRVWPRLLEQAVGFFLENHLMEKMVHGDDITTNDIVCKKLRVDFLAKETCIETKVPLSTWLPKGEAGYTRPSDLATLIRFRDRCIALQKHFRRVILLIILPDGGIEQTERESLFARLREAYQEEICRGLEIWSASLELQDDGIALVDYHNETEQA